MERSARITISDLNRGVYEHSEHHRLADKGRRRHHPYSFDFDSTPVNLDEPGEGWEEDVRRNFLENRAQTIERLRAQHGERNLDEVVANTRDLGPRGMSLITYHNKMYRQARHAFVVGAYYPALVAACALGERILNHLVLDLREDFRSSSHYKTVYRKASFDDWPRAVTVLSDWLMLVDGVRDNFLDLGIIRNRSIHFNAATYTTLRDDALSALKLLGQIISRQFGYFGRQPWFIEDTPGAQFIKAAYEEHPFVRTYLIPVSGFVGVYYGMELTPQGWWRHLDYSDYGDGVLSDTEFAKLVREREPAKVVSRGMIERQTSQQFGWTGAGEAS